MQERVKNQTAVFGLLLVSIAVNVQGQYTACCMLGCLKTECGKKQEFECKLFNAGTTFDSLRIQPSDKLQAGWGSSKTCKKDGNFVKHNNHASFITPIPACKPYQEQSTLTAEDDTKHEQEYKNKNKGEEACRALCEEVHSKDCVYHQYVQVNSM